MANKESSIEVKSKDLEPIKQEVESREGIERIRSRRAYVPWTTIYETEDEIVVLSDMPGVDDQSVDITLEKNELAITGVVEPFMPEDMSLVYSEFEEGDYQRTFIISDQIDRENIEASVKDGVLRVRLPKAPQAKARKISVKAG